MHVLDERLWFPPVDEADADGMLAIGGDLQLERLILAYSSGIFPWFVEQVPLWWCPDPRFVLFPEKLLIGRRLQKLMTKQEFVITQNECFEIVIAQCAHVRRPGQESTWITNDMQKAFVELHKAGYAHSFEAWQNGVLVGGLYGVWLGGMFCGESMFSLVPNASKMAFLHAVQRLAAQGVALIDCQVHTEFLASFGAEMIPRKTFIKLLQQLITPD